MTDVHIHVAISGLPGADTEEEPVFLKKPDVVAETVRAQMRDARVDNALAIGAWGAPDDDPLGINPVLRVAALVPGLMAIGVADPTRGSDRDHMRRVEAQIKTGQVKGMKAFLGYLPYGPNDAGYHPYYELADRYEVPVIFHTGDTYSTVARLKYAHPLPIDDTAIDFPKVSFVLAHFGNPWLLDAAEVIYKNKNVYADLSGLMVAETESLRDEEKRAGIEDMITRVAVAFRYTEKPDRILHGSDWPLVPMAAYRDIIRRIVPGQHHDKVFKENARDLFKIG